MTRLLKPLLLPNRVSLGLLLVRLLMGIAFLHHGYGKMQSPFSWMGPDATVPAALQLLAALSEFGGGLLLLLGLLTPLACLGIGSTMAVAVSMHLLVFHDPFVATAAGGGSYEMASVYFSLALLILLSGPGRYSLDHLIFGEKP